MRTDKVLLIIPAYNEEENIISTCNKIRSYNENFGTSYDFVVINDGSKDSTSALCHENNVKIIDLVENLGIGGAVQTGYKYALENGYDVAIQFDGDGQHDVSYVKKLLEPIKNDEADFVIGSRFVKDSESAFKSSFIRRVGINIISFAVKIVSGKKIFDTTSGFRAASRKIIELFAKSYPTEYPEPITNAEILCLGYKVKEVGVSMEERVGGVSSIRAWKSVYYMINVILSILICSSKRKRK